MFSLFHPGTHNLSQCQKKQATLCSDFRGGLWTFLAILALCAARQYGGSSGPLHTFLSVPWDVTNQVRQPLPERFVGDNFFLRRPIATEGDSSGKVGTLFLIVYFLELCQTLAFCSSCVHEVLQECKSKQKQFQDSKATIAQVVRGWQLFPKAARCHRRRQFR